jgi:hypothetical protein
MALASGLVTTVDDQEQATASLDDRLPSEAALWTAPPPKQALRPGWSNRLGLPLSGPATIPSGSYAALPANRAGAL